MPSDKFLNASRHRFRRLALRFSFSAFVLVLLLCSALRIYAGYMAHRAFALLDEASRVPVGANEDSLLPLVARYGGVKRIPQPPTSIDDCSDEADCAFRSAHTPDFAYEFELSPFNVFAPSSQPLKGFRRLLALLMVRTPNSLRSPLSLRAWVIFVNIQVRAQRVEGVAGGLYVEGRTRWLANNWNLSADMPRPESQSKAYVVDGFTLTMTYGGAGTQHHLTPAATAEQFESARSFNAGCITSLVPCRCLADLTPRAFEYINHHPEVGSTVITEGCPGAPSR